MRQQLSISLLLSLLFGHLTAQETSVSVSQGPGYANQLWYSLENGEVAQAAKTEWDIAFSIASFSSSIHINPSNNHIVKVYPHGTINDWDNVDETGFDTWPALNNSSTSWETGAFDQNNSGSSMDFGWGVYNPVTHFVTGDSLYIIKTGEGNFKKLRIINLTVSGVYNFDISDINGANFHSLSLAKSDYTGKLFGYYSISNNAFLNREPASDSWDLLFTQYTEYVPSAYTVAGVLHHPDVEVLEVNGVNPADWVDWSGEFSIDINTIGYDWKTFNGMGFDIVDDRVYFVKDQEGDIWKLVFTGFGGSGTGNYEFTKEKISANSIREEESTVTIGLYPNPANTMVNVVMGAVNTGMTTILIMDLQGRTVHRLSRQVHPGMNTIVIDVNDMPSGYYLVSIASENQIITKNLQVAR